MPLKILFVCRENSNRSQMSEAFARLHGKDVMAFSAGSEPSGIVNPKAIASMKELDYDLSAHVSKSVDDIMPHAPFDVLVTMGCGDSCPHVPAHHRIDWQIPDPRDMNEEDFRVVRDLIGSKVKQLLAELSV
jgi:protein-tyrosine-phosphatase